jgi:hypothetical protein
MKKISIYTMALSSLMLGSCGKDFLKRVPATQIATSEAFQTANDVQSALNGVYANMRGDALYGRDWPIIGDVMSDNAYIEVRNSGRYLPQWQYTVTVTDATVSEDWSGAYNAILECNNIIDAKISGLSATDQATVTQLTAQAYALRGLLYLNLVNFYATPYTKDSSAMGVPLILHYDPFLYPARNSVGEIFTQIVSDLKAGLANAPAYVNSITLSKYSIEGLLARAYMFMGDYTDAETAAVDVINSSGFTLVSPANWLSFWQNSAVQTDATEVMFEIDCNILENNSTGDLGGFYFEGYQDAYCSQQLYSLYTPTDVRRSVIDSGFTKSGAAAFVVEKFPNYNNADKDNLKVIRLADVYLMAAEAAVTSSPTTAQGYLNSLRGQRDPAAPLVTATGAALLDTIILERRKELAFEGDRLWTLQRLGWDVDRGGNNPGALPAGPSNVNLTVPFTDYRRLAPIPESETQVNPNIAPQQNPGY